MYGIPNKEKRKRVNKKRKPNVDSNNATVAAVNKKWGQKRWAMKAAEGRISKKLTAKNAANTSINVADLTVDQIMANRESVVEIEFSNVGQKVLGNHPEHVKNVRANPLVEQIRLLKGEKSYYIKMETLLCIIYCALNISNSQIQLSDLLRFIQEGHVSLFDFRKFLPKSSIASFQYHNNKFGITNRSVPLIDQIRKRLNHFVKTIPDLWPCLKSPNLLDLSKRYITELCLPKDTVEMVGYLIKNYPLDQTKFQFLLNYEAIAIAYIIIALKFAFEFDGVYEKELQTLAEDINGEIEYSEINAPKYFLFDEWLKFIEYRTIVMKRYYVPLMFHDEKKTNNEHFPIAEFLTTLRSKTVEEEDDYYEEEPPTADESKINAFRKQVANMLTELLKQHDENPNKDRDEMPTIAFEPSMTPTKDYFEFIVKNYGEKLCLNMELASSNFTETSLSYYFDPSPLIQKFTDLNFKIVYKKLPINNEFAVINGVQPTDPFKQNYKINFDIRKDEWKKIAKEHIRKDDHNIKKIINQYAVKKTALVREKLFGPPPIGQPPRKKPEPKTAVPDDTLEFPARKDLYWTRTEREFNFADGPERFGKFLKICATVVNTKPEVVFNQVARIETAIFPKKFLK